jgi:hypothetical protein
MVAILDLYEFVQHILPKIHVEYPFELSRELVWSSILIIHIRFFDQQSIIFNFIEPCNIIVFFGEVIF